MTNKELATDTFSVLKEDINAIEKELKNFNLLNEQIKNQNENFKVLSEKYEELLKYTKQLQKRHIDLYQEYKELTEMMFKRSLAGEDNIVYV